MRTSHTSHGQGASTGRRRPSRRTRRSLTGALAALATASTTVLLAPPATGASPAPTAAAHTASPSAAAAWFRLPRNTGRLVFTHWTSSNVIEDVHRVDADGSGETALTSTPAVSDRDPEWSFDGTRVAFHRGDGVGTITGLWTTDADGGDLTAVPNTDGGFSATWSPDGTRLAYVCPDPVGGDTEICTIALDGSDLQTLTSTPGHEGSPAWSPDGSEIAFSRSSASEDRARLVALDPVTLSERALTPSVAGRYDSGPAWAPHGHRLAFSRIVVGSGEGSAVYVTPSRLPWVRLVTAPAAGSGLHHTTPTWAPRGGWLAFSEAGDDGESGHLFRVRASGHGLTQLTFGDRTDLDPSWR